MNQLIAFDFSTAGLEIDYVNFLGQEHTLIANPEQCADLFYKAGFIQSYFKSNNLIYITYEVEFAYADEQTFVKRIDVPWSDFCLDFDLSDADVKKVIIIVELSKNLN